MKGYWVVRGHILDPIEYGKYIELAGPAIKKHNGVFLSRGGKQLEKEGSGYERTVMKQVPVIAQMNIKKLSNL